VTKMVEKMENELKAAHKAELEKKDKEIAELKT